MLLFETVGKPRESSVGSMLGKLGVGAWLVICGLLLWPFTLLGMFFWAMQELTSTWRWQPR